MVEILIEQLKEIGWNRKALDEEDFSRFIRNEGILLSIDDEVVRGTYRVINRVPVITLNPSLTREERLRVGFEGLLCHWLRVDSASSRFPRPSIADTSVNP
jgi:hypothetical protein